LTVAAWAELEPPWQAAFAEASEAVLVGTVPVGAADAGPSGSAIRLRPRATIDTAPWHRSAPEITAPLRGWPGRLSAALQSALWLQTPVTGARTRSSRRSGRTRALGHSWPIVVQWFTHPSHGWLWALEATIRAECLAAQYCRRMTLRSEIRGQDCSW
jgi:hypothetical protein